MSVRSHHLSGTPATSCWLKSWWSDTSARPLGCSCCSLSSQSVDINCSQDLSPSKGTRCAWRLKGGPEGHINPMRCTITSQQGHSRSGGGCRAAGPVTPHNSQATAGFCWATVTLMIIISRETALIPRHAGAVWFIDGLLLTDFLITVTFQFRQSQIGTGERSYSGRF